MERYCKPCVADSLVSWTLTCTQKENDIVGEAFRSEYMCFEVSSKRENMVGKTDSSNGSDSVTKSDLDISLTRASVDFGELDYSPTFPNTWKSIHSLGRCDSWRRHKRYTVACFPSSDFAASSQLVSSETTDNIAAYAEEERFVPLVPDKDDNLPRRKRFSSGFILGLFMKKQDLANVQQRQKAANTKKKLHKIHSAPNIKSEKNATGIHFLEYCLISYINPISKANS